MADGPSNNSTEEGRLAAAVHETTNALTVILGWIERARHAHSREQANEALDRARSHANMARESMRQAIGAQAPPRATKEAAELARRTLDDLAVEAQHNGVELATDIERSAGGRLIDDSTTVWQILTNLLLNAVAFTPRGGRISLRLSGTDDGSVVLFSVRDSGPGVPDGMRESIFGGMTQRRSGAGIGLRHARDLARAAGGELSLRDSTAEGACFELRWPIARPDSLPPESARTQTISTHLNGLQVLLLEDDAAVVELLQLSLQSRGATITAVTDANQLDDALDEGVYDVLLVDLSPLGDGLDNAVDKARERSPGLTVVAISGSVTVQPRPDVVWVRKPFSPSELTTAIVRERARAKE